jgi:acetylornithine deacetylase/succinyl-diaminopimelate desuccinylase-like protein
VQNAALTRWSPRPGIAWTTAVENVLVRVPGTDSSRAILIEGHYDSVPTGPGATDCGACTVTVLEALRAILAGPPLKNDVIFLFADGEEVFISLFLCLHLRTKTIPQI